ncbi:DUF4351 domain-containing protein [Cylindrospermopsis raciborskii]|nr:DUF4351 domain-containing protein [Cylindrospermopsis raciborskii]
MVIRQLTRRLGELSERRVGQIRQLSVPQLEALALPGDKVVKQLVS